MSDKLRFEYSEPVGTINNRLIGVGRTNDGRVFIGEHWIINSLTGREYGFDANTQFRTPDYTFHAEDRQIATTVLMRLNARSQMRDYSLSQGISIPSPGSTTAPTKGSQLHVELFEVISPRHTGKDPDYLFDRVKKAVTVLAKPTPSPTVQQPQISDRDSRIRAGIATALAIAGLSSIESGQKTLLVSQIKHLVDTEIDRAKHERGDTGPGLS